jgi:hypothetical protein
VKNEDENMKKFMTKMKHTQTSLLLEKKHRKKKTKTLTQAPYMNLKTLTTGYAYA